MTRPPRRRGQDPFAETIARHAPTSVHVVRRRLVASLAAVRIGTYDLAVGNLFGSNAFNMTILFAADLAYGPGPILAAVDPAQVVAGVGAILLMAIALAAVVHGTRTRIRRLEPDAVALLATYALLLGAVWAATS